MDNGYSVMVEGGRPWGFSLQGGLEFRAPLRVGKVSGRREEGGRGRGVRHAPVRCTGLPDFQVISWL